MIFDQGNKNSCIQRSMCSVLMYIRKSRDVKDEFLNKIIDDLNRSRIYNEPNYKKGKINMVVQYMRSKGFQMKKFESKKRNRNGRSQNIDVLAQSFDTGLFCLMQICGNDYDNNHTIMICDGWIFDSNHERAIPLCQEGLNLCISSNNKYGIYESCPLMYRFEHKKINTYKNKNK